MSSTSETGASDGEPRASRDPSASEEDVTDALGPVPSAGAQQSTSAGLRRLAAEIGNDVSVVDRFVCDYLGLLDHRMDGLAELLAGDDPQATRIWVLSLETTSSMLGATEVVSTAAALRALVAAGDDEATMVGYRVLEAAVSRLRTSLNELGFSARPPSRSAAG